MPNSPGRVRHQKMIIRGDVRGSRSCVFVFGDNMERRGLGGQAGVMRGEANAIGIPTKWSPDMRVSAFFTDDCLTNHEVMSQIDAAFDKLEFYLSEGLDVIIPSDGVGTGLAELPKRAPRLHQYIEDRIRALGSHPKSGEREVKG